MQQHFSKQYKIDLSSVYCDWRFRFVCFDSLWNIISAYRTFHELFSLNIITIMVVTMMVYRSFISAMFSYVCFTCFRYWEYWRISFENCSLKNNALFTLEPSARNSESDNIPTGKVWRQILTYAEITVEQSAQPRIVHGSLLPNCLMILERVQSNSLRHFFD